MQFSSSTSQPLPLSASTAAQTYLLLAFAVALSLLGVFVGLAYTATILGTGAHLLLLFVELGLVVTARWWVEKSPLNIVLFGLFPLLSGVTFAPYVFVLLTGYANGAAILLNGLGACLGLTLTAALAARALPNLSWMGSALLYGLIGLVAMGLIQLFVPSWQTGVMELALSGIGIVLFSAFIAYDLQRVAAMGRLGANPFLLALSLYLDIFNLLTSILRFMTSLSGERR